MTNFVTKDGFAKLRTRLEYLKTTRRHDVALAIETARSVSGDFTDNPEMESARQEQSAVEHEIAELEAWLDNAQVITKQSGSMKAVRIGSVVKVRSANGAWKFMIVGSAEADPRAGKISHISPIGRALLNHQPGEKVLVQLPEGHAEYEICTVS